MTIKTQNTQNTIIDLNNYMFVAMENLLYPENEENLDVEIERSKAVAGLSTKIIENAKLMLEAKRYQDEFSGMTKVSRILIGDEE